MDQTTIDRALLGDPEAAKACTEAGVAIPCPFCGEEGSLGITPTHKYQVWCPRCHCVNLGSFHSTAEEALSDWNRRADLRGMGKEAPQQWIPVGERLPEHTGHVLILSRDPYGELQVNISAYTHIVFGGQRLPARAWMEPYECFSQHDTVTHWMPLPQPPITGGDT